MQVSGLESAEVSRWAPGPLSRQYEVEGSPRPHRKTELCPKSK